MKKLFGQTSFQVFLFCAALSLFNWPLLTIFPLERQGLLFFYLYAVWGVLIGVLFLVSKSDV